ncbi:MAG: hypothetical protein ACK54P_15040, partial [Bacteroidota bacterium]
LPTGHDHTFLQDRGSGNRSNTYHLARGQDKSISQPIIQQRFSATRHLAFVVTRRIASHVS